MGTENGRVYEFSGYLLDPSQRYLFRDGRPVPLPPKAVETLLVLVEHGGRVVDKAYLMKSVWPDVTVEENNLTQNVSLLRKTLGEGSGDLKLIETIPRRGYRFVAPVRGIEQPAVAHTTPPASGRTRRGFAAALLSVGVLAAVVGAILVVGGRGPSLALRQLTTNSTELPLSAGGLSPDGRYFAYVDGAGIHLKAVDTGESRSLPPVAGTRVTDLCWFPDSIRLLASGYPAGDREPAMWEFSLLRQEWSKIREGGTAAVPSPSGSQIAFLSGDHRRLHVMGASGDSSRSVFTAGVGERIGPVQWISSWQLAFTAIGTDTSDPARTPIKLDLISVDERGADPVRIPFDPAASGGVLLRDRLLVYAATAAALPNWGPSTLWARQLDFGPGEKPVRPHRLYTFSPGVSPFHFTASSGGRRIAFLNGQTQSDVFVADLQRNGTALVDTRRLTLDDHNDLVAGWSTDSGSVLFFSDRNGSFDIFEQRLDQQVPEPLATTTRDETGPFWTPDGKFLVYAVQPEGWKTTALRAVSWMRMERGGGTARDIFGRPVSGDIKCPAIPDVPCMVLERRRQELVMSTVSIATGERRETARIPTGEHSLVRYAISPDGRRLAFTAGNRIRVVDLTGKQTGDVSAGESLNFVWVSWAPDSSAFYVSYHQRGRTGIAMLGLDGTLARLLETEGESEAAVFPSPDGKRLAFTRWSSANNAWLIEGL
jgi:DNA-binding winged helix-turn-helix (wHTH) protein/Tol biopolymer transport system component